jgi:ABC-2 type transport system permease protein
MEFIVPGLVMMSIINSSFANVVGSFYIAKFQKSIEELLVSPSSNLTIIAGYITGGVTRGLLVGVLVFLISLLFTATTIYSPLTIILFAVLTSCLFSMLALINAIFAKNFDHTSIVTTFVLTPLTYLGGVFYSIDKLPEVWRSISQFNPIVYMIDGIRYGFLGINTYPLAQSFLVIFTLLILSTIFAYYYISRSHGLRS